MKPWFVTIILATACGSSNKGAVPTLPPLSHARDPTSELVPWRDADGRYGYADRQGKLVIPARFNGARPFYEGLAAASEDDGWGFIDTSGSFRISPSYTGVEDFLDGQAAARHFKEPWLGPIMNLVLKHG